MFPMTSRLNLVMTRQKSLFKKLSYYFMWLFQIFNTSLNMKFMDSTPTTLVPFHLLKSVFITYYFKDILQPPSRSPEDSVQATLEMLYAFLSYIRSTCPAYHNPVFICPTGLEIGLDFAAPRHECTSTAYLNLLMSSLLLMTFYNPL